MATCRECGKSLGLLTEDEEDICENCALVLEAETMFREIRALEDEGKTPEQIAAAIRLNCGAPGDAAVAQEPEPGDAEENVLWDDPAPAIPDAPEAVSGNDGPVDSILWPEEAECDPSRPADESDPVERVLLTTETGSDLPIAQRIEVVTGECAFGMNTFRDLFPDVRAVSGSGSEEFRQTMREIRRETLYALKREAHALGADAVVGVEIDYRELRTLGTMVFMVASGTAVRLAQRSAA